MESSSKKQEYSLISELTILEKIMPKYEVNLREISLLIRNKLWNSKNESQLAEILGACNKVIALFVDILGEQTLFLEMYVHILRKYKFVYANTSDVLKQFDIIDTHIRIKSIGELIDEHWKQINPLLTTEYSKDDFFDKNLLELFDDFFSNLDDNTEEFITLSLSSPVFAHLCRGRRGAWRTKIDLAAPSIEIAVKNKMLNRWNPPNKRYLYLAVGNNTDLDHDIVYQEMRLSDGIEHTVSYFSILDTNKGKIINMDFSQISREQILSTLEEYKNGLVEFIVSKITNCEVLDIEKILQEELKVKQGETKQKILCCIAQLFLKEICDVVFVPLDSDEDNDHDLKEKCYKSFHVLAEYLESHGFSGICYPSTRMNMVGKYGTNLVLFDADNAEAIEHTFKIYN